MEAEEEPKEPPKAVEESGEESEPQYFLHKTYSKIMEAKIASL